jgi:hypothetical protein
VVLAAPGPTDEWCVGAFAGRVTEAITPVCGFRELCPAHVAVVQLGRFAFRVRGPADARG